MKVQETLTWDGQGVGNNYGYSTARILGSILFVPQHLAHGKAASQSSDDFGGDADKAVDGNTDCDYLKGNSVTHTKETSQPWWQVDLGSVRSIGKVVIWNRTDTAADRLANFYVFASRTPFTSTDPAQTAAMPGMVAQRFDGAAGTSQSFNLNCDARYIRVQLTGTNALSLAEVQVFAPGHK
jgi:hypothetical protein